MTPPIQEPSTARDTTGLGWASRQLARRPPLTTGEATLDFAQITMADGQLITQSTAWSGVGFNPVTIVMDGGLIPPGGVDAQHSPSGAFYLDTGSKRLDLLRTGIYFCQVQVSETGEWLGLTDYYWWNLTTSGAGYIWNSDSTYPLNGFEANAPFAEWYKTYGPLIVHADDSNPVHTGWHVAQQKFNPATLGAFITTWSYQPALDFDFDVVLSDLQQSF